jgi:hypothetical protein
MAQSSIKTKNYYFIHSASVTTDHWNGYNTVSRTIFALSFNSARLQGVLTSSAKLLEYPFLDLRFRCS